MAARFCSQGTDPTCLDWEQGATYYGNAWAHRHTSPLFTSTYCPALLIEVLGPTVRVSAVYWLDKVCMVRRPLFDFWMFRHVARHDHGTEGNRESVASGRSVEGCCDGRDRGVGLSVKEDPEV